MFDSVMCDVGKLDEIKTMNERGYSRTCLKVHCFNIYIERNICIIGHRNKTYKIIRNNEKINRSQTV